MSHIFSSYVFCYLFFDNSAWLPEEGLTPYLKLRDKYQGATRMSKPFKEALDAIETAWQALPVSSRGHSYRKHFSEVTYFNSRKHCGELQA